MMVRDELLRSDETPARIIYKALNNCRSVAVKHQRKRHQEDPSSSHPFLLSDILSGRNIDYFTGIHNRLFNKAVMHRS